MSDAGFNVPITLTVEGEAQLAAEISNILGKAMKALGPEMAAAINKALGSIDTSNLKKGFDAASAAAKDLAGDIRNAGKAMDALADRAKGMRSTFKGIDTDKLFAVNTHTLDTALHDLRQVDAQLDVIGRNEGLRKALEVRSSATSRITTADSAAIRLAQAATETASRERIAAEKTVTARVVAEGRERTVAAQREGAQVLAETRAASNQRVAVLQAAVGQIRVLESALGSIFKGTARAIGASFSGLGGIITSAMHGVTSRLHAADSSFDEGLAGPLNHREAMIRASFEQQENIIRNSTNQQEAITRASAVSQAQMVRQSATLGAIEAQSSRGIAGVVSGRSQLGAALGGGVAIGGGYAIFSRLKSGFEDAVNAGEQVNATTVLLGESAQGVLDWSESSVKGLGLTNAAALQAANGITGLVRPMGATQQEAAILSASLVGIGADLASFYNTDITQAQDAIRSGLVGESEPLRKYGVILNETLIKQKAFELGLTDSAKAIPEPWQKAQAVIALISEQTEISRGDFQNTADGYANAARIAGASVDQFFSDFAIALRGPLTTAMKGIIPIFETLRHLVTGLGDDGGPLTGFLASLRTALIGVGVGLGGLVAIKGVVEIFQFLSIAVSALLSPLGLLIAAFALVGGGIALLAESSASFRDVITEIKGSFLALGRAFMANNGDVTSSGLAGVFERIGNAARTAFNAIGDFGKGVIEYLGPRLKAAAENLRGLFTGGDATDDQNMALFGFDSRNTGEKIGDRIRETARTVGRALATARTFIGEVISGSDPNTDWVNKITGFDSRTTAEQIGDRIRSIGSEIGDRLLQARDNIRGIITGSDKFDDINAIFGIDTRNMGEKLGDGIRDLIGKAKQLFASARTAIGEIISGSDLNDDLSLLLAGKDTRTGAEKIGDTIRDVLGAVRDAITGFWSDIQPIIRPAVDGIRTLIDAVKDIANVSPGKGLLAIGGVIAGAFGGFALGGPIGAAIGGVAAGIAALFATGLDDEMGRALSGVGDTIVRGLSAVGGKIKDGLGEVLDIGNLFDVTMGLGGIAEKIGRTIGNIASDPRLLAAAAGLAAAGALIAVRFVEGLAKGIAGNLPEIADMITDGLSAAVKEGVKFLFKDILFDPQVLVGAIAALLVGLNLKGLFSKAGTEAGTSFSTNLRNSMAGGAFSGGGEATSKLRGGAFLQGLFGGPGEIERAIAQKGDSMATASHAALQKMTNTLNMAGVSIPAGASSGAVEKLYGQLIKDIGPAGEAGLRLNAAVKATINSVRSAVGGIASGIGSAAGGVASGVSGLLGSIFGSAEQVNSAGKGVGAKMVDGLRAGMANISSGFDPMREQFAKLRAEGMTTGQAIGAALKGGATTALGAVTGLTVGKSLGESGAGGLDSLLGVAGVALAMSTFSPVAGLAAGAAGLAGLAFGRMGKDAKDAAEHVKGLVDQLSDVSLGDIGNQVKIVLGDLIKEIDDAFGAEDTIDISKRFNVGDFAKDAVAGTTTVRAEFDKLARTYGAVGEAFIASIDPQVDTLGELKEAMGGSTLEAKAFSQVVAEGMGLEAFNELLGIVNSTLGDTDKAMDEVAANKLLTDQGATPGQLAGVRNYAESFGLNEVQTTFLANPNAAQEAVDIAQAGIPSLEMVLDIVTRGDAEAKKKIEEQTAAAKDAAAAFEVAQDALELWLGGNYSGTAQAAIDNLILALPNLSTQLTEAHAEGLSQSVQNALDRQLTGEITAHFTGIIKTSLIEGNIELTPEGVQTYVNGLKSELDAALTAGTITQDFHTKANAILDGLVDPANFRQTLQNLVDAGILPESVLVNFPVTGDPVPGTPPPSAEVIAAAKASLLAGLSQNIPEGEQVTLNIPVTAVPVFKPPTNQQLSDALNAIGDMFGPSSAGPTGIMGNFGESRAIGNGNGFAIDIPLTANPSPLTLGEFDLASIDFSGGKAGDKAKAGLVIDIPVVVNANPITLGGDALGGAAALGLAIAAGVAIGIISGSGQVAAAATALALVAATAVQASIGPITMAGGAAGAGYAAGIVAAAGAAGAAGAALATAAVVASLGALGPMGAAGTGAGTAYATGVGAAAGAAAGAGRSLGTAAVGGASGGTGAMESIGSNMGSALASGLASKAKEAAKAAASIVTAAIGAARAAAAVASPSQEFVDIGDLMGEGMVVGLEGQTGAVSDAAASLAQAAVDGAAGYQIPSFDRAASVASLSPDPMGWKTAYDAYHPTETADPMAWKTAYDAYHPVVQAAAVEIDPMGWKTAWDAFHPQGAADMAANLAAAGKTTADNLANNNLANGAAAVAPVAAIPPGFISALPAALEELRLGLLSLRNIDGSQFQGELPENQLTASETSFRLGGGARTEELWQLAKFMIPLTAEEGAAKDAAYAREIAAAAAAFAAQQAGFKVLTDAAAADPNSVRDKLSAADYGVGDPGMIYLAKLNAAEAATAASANAALNPVATAVESAAEAAKTAAQVLREYIQAHPAVPQTTVIVEGNIYGDAAFEAKVGEVFDSAAQVISTGRRYAVSA